MEQIFKTQYLMLKTDKKIKEFLIMRTELLAVKDEQPFVLCYTFLIKPFDSINEFIKCMVHSMVTNHLKSNIHYCFDDIVNDIIKDFGIRPQSDTFRKIKSYIKFLYSKELNTRLIYGVDLFNVLGIDYDTCSNETVTMFWDLITDLLNDSTKRLK